MNKHLSLTLLTFSVLTLGCHAKGIKKPDPSISDKPTSSEILSKLATIYRGLATYQDEGVVFTKYEGSTPGHTSKIVFKTAYSRTGKFRFEYNESERIGGDSQYVIWKDGDVIKTWWTIRPQVEVHENISSAISGATGVSGGSAYTIPSALMPEAAWKGCNWTETGHAYRISDAVDNGISCFRIQRQTSTKAETHNGIASPATKGIETYWIRTADYILVRIDDETDFGDFQTVETTTYSPIINKPIPDSLFAFKH